MTPSWRSATASLSPRNELGYVELRPAAQRSLAHAADPGLSARLPERLMGLADGVADAGALGVLRGPSAPLAVPGGDHGDPHLIVELLVEHRSEDDVRVGVCRLRHGPGRFV